MVQFFVLEQKKLEISMGTPRLSSVAITELPRMLIKTGFWALDRSPEYLSCWVEIGSLSNSYALGTTDPPYPFAC